MAQQMLKINDRKVLEAIDRLNSVGEFKTLMEYLRTTAKKRIVEKIVATDNDRFMNQAVGALIFIEDLAFNCANTRIWLDNMKSIDKHPPTFTSNPRGF